MPAVHLSCHGLNNWRPRPGAPGVPVLLMENELGEGRPTTVADLVRLLTVVPRLLLISACLTATGADASGHLPPGDGRKGDPGSADGTDGLVAHSLATALVEAGVPAVIGWDGSVGDRSATAFAERLYRELADRADLAVAVGDARLVLLESEDPHVRADPLRSGVSGRACRSRYRVKQPLPPAARLTRVRQWEQGRWCNVVWAHGTSTCAARCR